MAHIDVFKSWAGTIRQDIDAFKTLLESTKADEKARRLAGGALSYLVSKMDLIPDWNPGIGVIDDVMVMRVCAVLSADFDRGELPGASEATFERMSNEAEKIQEFLGGALYDKLKAYSAKLGDLKVRGKSVGDLISDTKAREAFYKTVEEEVSNNVPIVISDPNDAEIRLKSYLSQKLK
jgi:uncharacterized membrane protein YkvA (DUF1232 family)